MPVLTRRHQGLAPRQLMDIKPSIESPDSKGEPLWDLSKGYEGPQKEMDFPLTFVEKIPSRKGSVNNLRINTYPSNDLPDRYMESEEEPSPSPDSDTESNEAELEHDTIAASTTGSCEPLFVEEYEAEIAIAVPIVATGRPKLVDITNLAPMHKRKRQEMSSLSRSLTKSATSRVPLTTNENAGKMEVHDAKHSETLSSPAPDSWLPDDVTIVPEEEEDHYFPDLELRKPPTYHDYDPYSLDPPSLSPRNSCDGVKKPGNVARARNSSNAQPPVGTNRNGWKGLTRSLSIAKKQALHRRDQQVIKRPKMIARAADEREAPLVIPLFPLREKDMV